MDTAKQAILDAISDYVKTKKSNNESKLYKS